MSRFVISKTYAFSASHRLDHLPETHKCHRLHGHNYTVTLLLGAAELDADGFVEDFGALEDVKDYLAASLDHRHLNDVLAMPTSERLAAHIFEIAKATHPALVEVVVSETPTSRASYRP